MSKAPKIDDLKPSILFVPWENTGVGLYRIIIPALSLAANGLADVETADKFTGFGRDTAINLQYVADSINKSKHDIVYTTRPLIPQQVAFGQTMQHYGYKWVMDIDDNILEVNKDNPGYNAFDKSGSGDNRFYVEVAMREADMLVVSTENLKDVYSVYNKNIFVNPNTIDFRFWKLDNANGKGKKIVIGWAGAGGHKFDLSLIEEVAQELKKKWGDKIEFVSFGGEQPKFFDRHVDWVELHKYPAKLASLGFDIGLAPLRDNLYNRGKSNLRWLEYSALKIPTVASDVLPYKDTNAMLCVTHEDWIQALDTLIADKDIRESLGEASYNIVRKKFSAERANVELVKRLNRLVWKKQPSPKKSK